MGLLGAAPLGRKTARLKRRWPETWQAGQMCAALEYQNLIGRPQSITFTLLLGWDREIPSTQESIDDFLKEITPQATENMVRVYTQEMGVSTLPEEAVAAMGIAFALTMSDLLTTRFITLNAKKR